MKSNLGKYMYLLAHFGNFYYLLYLMQTKMFGILSDFIKTDKIMPKPELKLTLWNGKNLGKNLKLIIIIIITKRSQFESNRIILSFKVGRIQVSICSNFIVAICGR